MKKIAIHSVLLFISAFAFSQAPLKVLIPNGGETWEKGKSYTIKWTGVEPASYVRIDLLMYKEGEQTRRLTLTNRTENDGDYQCKIPNNFVDFDRKMRIEIYLEDSKTRDQSDNYFTITKKYTTKEEKPLAPSIDSIFWWSKNDSLVLVIRDNSSNEDGFRIICIDNNQEIGRLDSNITSNKIISFSIKPGTSHKSGSPFSTYKVVAYNSAGETSSDPRRFGLGEFYALDKLEVTYFDQPNLKGNLLKWSNDAAWDGQGPDPWPLVTIVGDGNTGKTIAGKSYNYQYFNKGYRNQDKGCLDLYANSNSYKYKILTTYSSQYTSYAVAEFSGSRNDNIPKYPTRVKELANGDIQWDDNSTNEDGYLVEFWRQSTGIWTEVCKLSRRDGVNIITLKKKDYSILNISPGERYAYLITAFNQSGNAGAYYCSDPLYSPFPINLECTADSILMPECNSLKSPCCVWDWTGTVGNLPADFGKYSSVNPKYATINSPWRGVSNPIMIDDINKPEDGWRLLYADLTHQERNPSFSIYNKYDGRLRVFYYGSVSDKYSESTISLRQNAPKTQKLSLFNAGEGLNYASDYLDLDESIGNIQKVSKVLSYPETWAWSEFLISYDPKTLNRNNSLIEIPIDGFEVSTVDLLGSFNANTPESFTASYMKNNKGIVEIFDNVQKGYSTADGIKEAISNKLNEIRKKDDPTGKILNEPDSKSTFEKRVEDLFATGVGKAALDYLPIIGGFGGLLKTVLFSNPSSEAIPVIISLEGTFKSKGTINTRYNAGYMQLRMPGTTPNTSSPKEIEPLYDYPLGVFTLLETPILIQAIEPMFHKNPAISLGWVGDHFFEQNSFRVLDNLKYEVNPYSGLKLKELYVSIIFTKGLTKFRKDAEGKIYDATQEPLFFEDKKDIINNHPILKKFQFEGFDTLVINKGTKYEVQYEYGLYRTPFIPYDRIKNFPLYTNSTRWNFPKLYDEVNGIKNCNYFTTTPIGVKVIAILERPDKNTPPIIFSDIFNVYYNHFNYYRNYDFNNIFYEPEHGLEQGDIIIDQNCKFIDNLDFDKNKHFFQNQLFSDIKNISEYSYETVRSKICKAVKSGQIKYWGIPNDDPENGKPARIYWNTSANYTPENPWPNISIGNLFANHQEIAQNNLPNHFKKNEEIIVSFVQYKSGSLIGYLDFKKKEGDRWSIRYIYPQADWSFINCLNNSLGNTKLLSSILDFDSQNYKYWSKKISISEPGYYRIRILKESSQISDSEWIEKEFQIDD